MSKPGPPPVGYYFFSLIYPKDSKEELIKFVETFGEPSEIFTPSDSPLFNYYSREMGKDIERVLYFYDKLTEVPKMLKLKLKALKLEEELASGESRRLNIDPGFYNLDQMFLTTFKWAPIRIYQDQGVYYDLQYFFTNGKYDPMFWCYPDYQAEDKLEVFNRKRRELKKYLRNMTN